MQLACLAITLYLGAYYRKGKKLPTYSSKLFGALWSFGTINLICDVVTVYTVNHMEIVPGWLNDLAHRLFIFSLDICMYLICHYIISLIERHIRVGKHIKVIIGMPLIIAMIIVMGTKMEYKMGVTTNYAVGFGALTCYLGVVLYLGVTMYCLIRFRNEIDKKNRDVVLTTTFILTIIGIFQSRFPEMLISSLGVTLCILSIFVIAENPSDLIDKQYGLFNEYGMVIVMHDWLVKGIAFSVIAIPIKNLDDIREKCSSKMLEKLYGMITKYVYYMLHEEVYLFSNRTLVIITKDRNIKQNKEQLIERFKKPWLIDGMHIEMNVEVQLIENAALKENAEEVLEEVLNIQKEACNKEAYMDTLMDIKNRNAFEKDMAALGANKDGEETIFYIAADVNGLKQVNDEYGHQAGDELLKSCAEIVRSIEDDNVKAYRLGGDEFGLLLINKTEDEVLHLISKMEKYRKRINGVKKHPVSFAVGYAKYDKAVDECLESMINRADQFMYKNKKEMKKKLESSNKG